MTALKHHFGRPRFLFLVAMCVVFVAAVSHAQSPSQISVGDGRLTIESHTNTYAAIVHPLDLGDEPDHLVAEVRMRVHGAVGASWAPGVYLYWDTSKWIGIRHTGGIYRMEGYVEGTWVREQDFAFAPLREGWNGLRLVWRGQDVDVYASHDMEEWQFLTSVARPGQGTPWLIVGKGFGGGSGSLPYLANPYSSLGDWGTSEFDWVKVTVDDETVLFEEFEGDALDIELWTPIRYGDSEVNEKIQKLNEIRQEQALRAGRTFAEVSEPSHFEVSFSLERWQQWRDHVTRPASLYKAAFIENARNNFSQDTFSRQALNTLRNDVRLVMGYGPEDIINMIPETTPTSTNWTPSPVSDRGFPHGDWSWSPFSPDVIVERATGIVFPNDDYPEDIVLTARVGDHEQQLTFHRSKNWVFNGFPLATSFTGHIRARKVSYMANQVENLGLLYALTGDVAYAKQAKAILLRFAEVYPNYLVHSGYHEFASIDALVASENILSLPEDELVIPPNQPNRQLHAGYWMAGRATGSGLEGNFLLPVTVAYDLVVNAQDEDGNPLFSEDERVLIERDLLLEGTKLLLPDNAINNKSVSARTAVAAVGAVVGDPELVRWGLDGLRRTLDEWFLEDGSTSESPAYGLMVMGTFWKLGEILYGYSDPEGYVDADGQRIDNLDIYRDPKYQAVWQNMYLSLLPNLRYPPIADSYTTSTMSEIMMLLMAVRFPEIPEFKSLLRTGFGNLFLLTLYRDETFRMGSPGTVSFSDVLFPSWKLAYLRAGRGGRDATVILNVSDWGGHHHYDSLDLFYWKNGNELLSDLGYLWDNPQGHMTRRTVAHNVVVVDESDQRGVGRGGSIHLFHPLGRFKVTEGSSAAYGATSLYRRFVAQVEHPGENSYVFDVFRVEGGQTHDLVLHGPGIRYEPQGIEFESSNVALSRYQFTNVREGSGDNWRMRWRAGSNWLQTLAIDGGNEQVLLADGWGQRETKDPYSTLPYLIRRRNPQIAGTEGTLGSRFVSLYEGYTSEPYVRNARTLTLTEGAGDGPESAVAVAIEGAHRTDYIVSAIHPESVAAATDHGTLRVQGMAGIASVDEAGVEILGVIGGRSIAIGDVALDVLAEVDELTGRIAEAHPSSFIIQGAHPQLAALQGWEIFIDEGRTQTAYPIRSVEVSGSNTTINTQDRLGGFPFAGGREWSIPQVGYVERHPDGLVQVAGTAPMVLTLPLDHVELTQLKWRRLESTSDEEWHPVAFEVNGAKVHITIPVDDMPGGRGWVRLR